MREAGADARGARGRDPRAASLSRIEELRRRIDDLDEQLVRVLNDRAACALEIGVLKQALGMEIYQPEREAAVLQHVRSLNPGPLTPEAIARLFERIIDEARRLERLAQGAIDRNGHEPPGA